MEKLSEEQIKSFAELYKKQVTKKELDELFDVMRKFDKKASFWINTIEIALTYVSLGLIWYNYGFGLSICIWMLSLSQVIGILKAEATGNAISRLYKRRENLTVESIIEELNDKWQSKKN
jgi:hypothetical protein